MRTTLFGNHNNYTQTSNASTSKPMNEDDIKQSGKPASKQARTLHANTPVQRNTGISCVSAGARFCAGMKALSSSSNFSIRAFRAYPLVELRQTVLRSYGCMHACVPAGRARRAAVPAEPPAMEGKCTAGLAVAAGAGFGLDVTAVCFSFSALCSDTQQVSELVGMSSQPAYYASRHALTHQQRGIAYHSIA